MPIKKALIIILVLFFISIIGFIFIYFTFVKRETVDLDKIITEQKEKEKEEKEAKKEEPLNVQNIIDKKNNNEALTQPEKERLGEVIKEKRAEKQNKIQNRDKQNDLTKEEMIFLLNPIETITDELGIKEMTPQDYNELESLFSPLPQDNSPMEQNPDPLNIKND